jgi:hypothetical protein
VEQLLVAVGFAVECASLSARAQRRDARATSLARVELATVAMLSTRVSALDLDSRQIMNLLKEIREDFGIILLIARSRNDALPEPPHRGQHA